MEYGLRTLSNTQLETYRQRAIQLNALHTAFAIHREQLRRWKIRENVAPFPDLPGENHVRLAG